MKQRYNRFIALAAALMMTAGALGSCGSKDASEAKNDAAASKGQSSYSVPSENADDQKSGNSDRTNEVRRPENASADEKGSNYAAESPMNILPDMEMKGEIMPEGFLPGGEEYQKIVENGFTLVSDAPLSTFSTDVDTASYANARRFLSQGLMPDPDSVRAEEFINYFNYNYAEPDGEDPIAITTELSDGSFLDGSKTKLLLVGVKAKDIKVEDRPKMNIVLLIDVSGSMRSNDKLPLAVQSFKMLAESLNEDDRVSIVTYSGEEKVVLEGAKGSETVKIEGALDSLTAGGSTAGEAGINMAYSLAEKYFIEGGNNRIVMATDGDLNVGVSSVEELTALVEKKREGGVFLSVLGFGTGNLKDDRLEALADNGNGNYSYIDSEREAKKVLSAEMQGTLFTVAKDVKAQIEFDPKAVAAYKLIGYENRALSNEDFTDDTKDAGDMGAGHTVTIIYEIVPAKGVLGSDGFCGASLDYTPSEPEGEPAQLAAVKLRYKQPDGNTSKEISKVVKPGDFNEDVPDDLAFAYCAASFARLLRGTGKADALHILETMNSRSLLTDEYRQEFAELVRTAHNLRPADTAE